MNNTLKIFSEIDFVLNMFNPLSYYGKLYKHNMEFFKSEEELSKEFDLIDIVKNNIFSNDFNVNKIQFHLSRIPQLPDQKEQYNSLELFRFKKFILNYNAVYKLLDEETVKRFNFNFDLDEIKNSLDIEEKDEETFYINENYSSDLKTIRSEINKINNQISELKFSLHEKLKTNFDLDFRFRDFLILPMSKAKNLDNNLIYIEPYDNKNLVVKPVYGPKLIELSSEKENFFVKEKLIEQTIIKEISDKINSKWDQIIVKTETVALFDRIFAKALLVKLTKSVRPELNSKNLIKLRSGRLLSLEKKCSEREIKYQPLTVELIKNVNVLHGSNMSGKTVTLKTLAFLQSLTQLGFFVPAESFSTHLFDVISYIGENNEEKTEGLSSFGIEIEHLINLIKSSETKKLVFLDEPARTTNSNEAVALLSAIIEYLNSNNKIKSLFSTHYTSLPKFQNVEYFKMKGIDWKQLNENSLAENPNNINDKISLINSNIIFEVVKETENEKKNNDAIEIAKILGLDENIIQLSKKYIEDGDEKL